ncbi:tRNA wybutosine-synthesizing protein [Acrasis kona]|uniref:tRNA wybutosine-synthesizing protein n=1 Tax=Acrasis kona TaxID=1008807 RepID=A0AAW2ZK82_9EUKA
MGNNQPVADGVSRKRSGTVSPVDTVKLSFNTRTGHSVRLSSLLGEEPLSVGDQCIVSDDEISKSVFLFSGITSLNGDYCLKMHKLENDETFWRSKSITPPDTTLPTLYHSAILRGDTNNILFFGDVAKTSLNPYSVLQYDVSLSQWSFLNFENHQKLRPFKVGSTPIYRGRTNSIIIFNDGNYGKRGDNDGIDVNSITQLNLSTHTHENITFKPSEELKSLIGVWYHSSVYHSRGDATYIFGGLNLNKFEPLNCMWCLDFKDFTCKKINPTGSSPTARYNHSSCIVGDYIFTFGGCHMERTGGGTLNRTMLNDLYQFDLISHTWRKILITGCSPSPRANFAMQMFRYESRGTVCLVVHGGTDQSNKQLCDSYVLMLPRMNRFAHTVKWNVGQMMMKNALFDCVIITK